MKTKIKESAIGDKRILVVFGTRPEAIKMGVLVHKLKETGFNVEVCVTAQHRNLLDQVNEFFHITPDFDLDLMQEGQTLNELSSRIIKTFDKILDDRNPDLVLVHGDTSTSMICALTSFHRGIKVGHVEAGLRTENKYIPFPEEMNRRITSKIAEYHFAPTQKACEKLLNEEVKPEHILVTGNTVIDALQWTVEKLSNSYHDNEIEAINQQIDFNKKIILVTAHRRENFGDGLEKICDALIEIAVQANTEIVFPVHPNPNVRKTVEKKLQGFPNIHLLNPLSYPAFVWLMNASYLILTDSGGIQEEAPSLGIPVLVLRESSERPEALETGNLALVGTDRNLIVQNTLALLNDEACYQKMSKPSNLYGNGNACERISSFLKQELL